MVLAREMMISIWLRTSDSNDSSSRVSMSSSSHTSSWTVSWMVRTER
jgi:hypothetical protein